MADMCAGRSTLVGRDYQARKLTTYQLLRRAFGLCAPIEVMGIGVREGQHLRG